MRRRSSLAVTRLRLIIEQLEGRLSPTGLTVVLDPVLDRTGDQIITVQGYDDMTRSAMSIFDTGSSAITFSATDQARFIAAGDPIPIKVPGGGVAEGIGGTVTGDVSQPGTILVGGLGTATVSYQPGSDSGRPGSGGSGSGGGSGSPYHTNRMNFQEPIDGALTPGTGVQAFIGTPQGSPHMPTLTGTPILYVDPNHPNGMAAFVNLHGATLDLSANIPGFVLSLANIQYVAPGLSLSPSSATGAAVTVPLTLRGIDNHLNPGNQVTETPTPEQTSVGLTEHSATVSGQTFLFDTGAQVTLISTATARALGFDLSHPDYLGSVSGVGGNVQVPGYTLDELDLPTKDGGLLRFTHAPVYVLDVSGADGILGMNLFNTASTMLYDPCGPGGPSVSFTFFAGTNRGPGDGSTPQGLAALAQLDSVLASTIHGTNVPDLALHSARIDGHVFLDYNRDGVMSGTEPGLPNQTVFLDTNGNGQLDPGELSTLTDSNGYFQFNNLPPGSYNIREVISSGLASVSSTRGIATLTAANGTTTSINFGVLPIQQDALTAYIADLYGVVLDRAPDIAGYTGWLSFLHNGGTRQEVANAIWQSPEHRGLQVDSFYLTLLHRPSDPAGRAGFVSLMLNGATEYDIQRMIITSPEYQALHNDNVSFLSGVFRDLLGRDIDQSTSNAWLTAMQNGLSRDQVARLVLTSLEHEMLEVDSCFLLFLHRQAQPADQVVWAQYIQQSNPTPDQLAEPFLGSDEFIALSRQLSSS
jgi:hypothetical protein